MLELLLYCHLFAKIRYAAEIEALADFVAHALVQGRAWLVRGFVRDFVRDFVRGFVRGFVCDLGREQRVVPFDLWSEQGLASSLAGLETYVASMA